MDFCRNISVSGGLPANYQPEQQLMSPSSCSKLGSLDDLFSGHCMEEGDVNMEWLSIFVEDCLSSSGNCLPPATSLAVIPPSSTPQSTTSTPTGTSTAAAAAAAPEVKKPHVENSLSLHKFVVPGKARSKRKRTTSFKATTPTCWSQQYLTTTSDPPLLQQTYWLADSELILPKKGTTPSSSSSRSREEVVKDFEWKEEKKKQEVEECINGQQGQGQGRKCSHCLSQRTPQWRAGPLGPKTLCNACGVRYKSGRLLPEYRPAKSPTFVSYKHSNSHKKVLEMRMSLQSSSSSPNSSSSS